MIKFNQVTHYYHPNKENEIISLSNVNLEIKPGDFIAIIGANGSGKSTLAKHFNGLLIPDKGEVTIDGMSTREKECRWDIRKRVGMVFQNPDNQLVATTVEDDIAFGLENIGMKSGEMRDRVKWALNIVGMSEYSHYEPHLLSGGQKQRVVIAGALAMKTNYLILDEPTSMLDPKGRKEVLEIVKKLNKEEKIAIIYITHFMNEAVEFENIIILNQGVIAAKGSTKDIFSKIDLLEKYNLELPIITKFAYLLNKKGLKGIPTNILNEEEMIRTICSYI